MVLAEISTIFNNNWYLTLVFWNSYVESPQATVYKKKGNRHLTPRTTMLRTSPLVLGPFSIDAASYLAKTIMVSFSNFRLLDQ